MSKYDYSSYSPEHGDSVWLECNGGRVKATVIDPSQMNGKYYEPRGKTKKAFLKRTRQGKWAGFKIDDYIVTENNSIGPYFTKGKVAKVIQESSKTGCPQSLYAQEVESPYDNQAWSIDSGNARHATPEEIAEATKSVDVWANAKYMLRVKVDKKHFPIDTVLRIKDQKPRDDYHFLIGENSWQWNAKHCKPITPAEMTRQQLLSIVEGLD